MSGELLLVGSVPLVLTRPEELAASGATVAQIERLLDSICAVCTPVQVSYLWRPMLRDADDEMVLEVAVNGRADLLLTFNERDFVGAGRLGVTVERPGPAWRSWRSQ